VLERLAQGRHISVRRVLEPAGDDRVQLSQARDGQLVRGCLPDQVVREPERAALAAREPSRQQLVGRRLDSVLGPGQQRGGRRSRQRAADDREQRDERRCVRSRVAQPARQEPARLHRLPLRVCEHLDPEG